MRKIILLMLFIVSITMGQTVDPVRNFARVTVKKGYDSTATTIVLNSGDGNLLPQPSTEGAFNLVWWNSSKGEAISDTSTVEWREIIRVTARSGDTLTITRAQDGTRKSNHNRPSNIYKMALTLSKYQIDQIRSGLSISRAGDTTFVVTVSGDTTEIKDSLRIIAGTGIELISSGNTILINSTAGSGTGDITGVTTVGRITGGGYSGNVTISFDSSGLATEAWVLAKGYITSGMRTIAVTAPLLITQVGDSVHVSIRTANASQSGALSSSDWSIFNGKVSTTRAINAGAGLSGGGDLSADRTLSIDTTSDRVETKYSRRIWTPKNYEGTIGSGDSVNVSFVPDTVVTQYRVTGISWIIGYVGNGSLSWRINSDSTATIKSDFISDVGKKFSFNLERKNP